MTALFRLVRVSGSDAAAFLQGQLTQDVRLLGSRASLPAAWCNPQGRVISTARLLSADADVGLVVPGSMAESMVERLARYRFRAAVEFTVADGEWAAHAVDAEVDLAALARCSLLPDESRDATRRAAGIVAVDTGARPRCVEVYGPPAAFRNAGLTFARPLSDSGWQRALVAGGIPTITAETSEKYTPHMLNLDCLGAVSFDKGCYTGQEVVARTEHLGKSRRRLMHYRTETAVAAVGHRLAHGEREVGDVVNVAGADFLAVVPVDLHGSVLTVAGHAAMPVELPYDLPR